MIKHPIYSFFCFSPSKAIHLCCALCLLGKFTLYTQHTYQKSIFAWCNYEWKYQIPYDIIYLIRYINCYGAHGESYVCIDFFFNFTSTNAFIYLFIICTHIMYFGGLFSLRSRYCYIHFIFSSIGNALHCITRNEVVFFCNFDLKVEKKNSTLSGRIYLS